MLFGPVTPPRRPEDLPHVPSASDVSYSCLYQQLHSPLMHADPHLARLIHTPHNRVGYAGVLSAEVLSRLEARCRAIMRGLTHLGHRAMRLQFDDIRGRCGPRMREPGAREEVLSILERSGAAERESRWVGEVVLGRHGWRVEDLKGDYPEMFCVCVLQTWVEEERARGRNALASMWSETYLDGDRKT
ncbi:hypothetical protein CONPUDRAFT_158998 [Coniophora puteana RWD-64-598 SS2]|uniref:Uncharacterized protein n=1 Tax=Coniophora puteana (strain RWD-64-598) TaxID=741705 RepID=A0A5M3M9L0_CONPW|nr:uncharacterized protein CONPUDRAFT_158998 [Coniophora puteana RWD-64-598 SS2]EIW75544.1 hypothetical protein CONPUDRAFT_158998 [Coniophora puteana RWD-64-598 SS2]